MLFAEASLHQTIEQVGVAVDIVGGACALGFVFWLARSGAWRNPLSGVPVTERHPSLVDVLLAFLAFGLLQIAGGWLLTVWVPRDAPKAPGSDYWHRWIAAEVIAKLLVSAAIVLRLRRCGRFASRPRGTLRLLAVTVLGLLIVLPVCDVLLNAVSTVWHWLEPDAVQPMHVVLEAMRNSAWGRWGVVELVASACIAAPIGEELFFRGLVLQATVRLTRHAWAAITVSAALFGFVHAVQPQAVIPLFAMGLALGYLRVRYDSLTLCIVIHALFNARTLIAALLAPELVQT